MKWMAGKLVPANNGSDLDSEVASIASRGVAWPALILHRQWRKSKLLKDIFISDRKGILNIDFLI